MNKTQIEYLDMSWNPIAMRCTPVSEGCTNCWHLRMADRLACNKQFSSELRAAYAGESQPVLVESRLDDPRKRKKPTTMGVQFMGDLFHEDVSDESIADVWNVMVKCSQHTFLVLTKRPERMRYWMRLHCGQFDATYTAPPKNIFLGVTVENQKRADERIPYLLQTPATVRFVSIEPMLGPVQLEHARFWLTEPGPHLDWVITGGESSPGARPMHPEWARSVRDQCQDTGVPFFFKQGSAASWETYKDFSSFPHDLQIREFPNG